MRTRWKCCKDGTTPKKDWFGTNCDTADDEGGGGSGDRCRCPVDEAGRECSGHGKCDKGGCRWGGAARCKCERGWYGGGCQKSVGGIIDDYLDREEMLNKTKPIQDHYRERLKECRRQGRGLVPCPGGKEDELRCEERLLDCYNTSKPERGKCDRGEKYCFALGRCVPIHSKILCPPIAGKCPDSRPVRCPNWKCAENKKECKPGGNRTDDDSAYCPDGSRGKSMKDCARNMTWDGCPAGKVSALVSGPLYIRVHACPRVPGLDNDACPN